MRTCKGCWEPLPESKFYKAGKYYFGKCKKCYNAQALLPTTSAGRLDLIREKLDAYWASTA